MTVILGIASCDAQCNFIGKYFASAPDGAGTSLATVVRDHVMFQQGGMPTTPEAVDAVLPATFAEGRYFLGFDGRLDNREDLARAVGIGRFAGLPDSVILAAAWEKWGEDSPNHLLGDFALAVWDDRHRSLTLACDQTTGGRPIFYHASGDRIAFSTSLAALLCVADVPRDLDPQNLAGAAQWRWPGHGATCFRDIRQLTPGGRLRWSAGRYTVDRYWQPDWSRRIRYRRDSDYVDAARELLDRAVAAHSRVVGPLVCELSGGLDSTAVVATAARQHPERRICTVTAVSDDGAILPREESYAFHDEWTRVRAVAALYPNVTAVRVPAMPMQADMADPQRQFARTGIPGPNPFDSSWFDPARAKVAALGARSVLVGASGNLTFSAAATTHLSDLAADGRWLALLGHAARLANAPGGASMAGLLRRAVRDARSGVPAPGGPDLGPAIAARYRRAAAVPLPSAPTHLAAERQGFFERTVESRRVANATVRALHGVETRDPLGYLPLVEFCFAIPPEQFLLGGVPRAFARRVLSDRLPPFVVQERRLGLQCPEIAARIGSQRDWLADTLTRVERSPQATDILDTAWIRATITAIPRDLGEMGPDFATPLRRVAAALQVGQFILWVEGGCRGLEIT